MLLNSQISYRSAAADFRTGKYTQALATINQLLDVQREARVYALLARTLLQLGMRAEAAQSFLLAAEEGEESAQEHLKEAIKLYFALGNKDQALALSSRLLPKQKMEPEIAFIISSIFFERRQYDMAAVFKDVLIKSNRLEHLQMGIRVAITSWDVFRASDIETARVVLGHLPDNDRIRLIYLSLCREHNKYDVLAQQQPLIEAKIAKGDTGFVRFDSPFYNVNWNGDERINFMARATTPRFDPAMTEMRRKLPHAWGKKIRVGYVSSDLFDRHATMKLVRRVLELHDREQFEITLFCHSKPENLESNTADRSTWGEVVSILDMSHEEAAAEIRRRQIDILVDLKGHTFGNRLTIFNRGAAPIQATWIGFPGSVCNVDLDYAIGDPIVLPDSSAPFYREKFCRLPDTYQANDSYNRPLPQPVTRKEVGLPDDAFIFGSFNANRKISQAIFEAWIRILKRTPDSMIAILAYSRESRDNMRRTLTSRGISDKRIAFMRKLDFPLHINRIPTVDLGLDTLPYNGHTTTSEQLWAGLPVLAVRGTNFASRVSESLLKAIGVPELVTESIDDYVERAVYYYEHRDELKGLKTRIEQNRFTAPLFDADRFRRHLESAYRTMVDRAKAGLPPEHFDVPALPPQEGPFLER